MIYKTYLIVIPARGGSKGIPKKNIKLLNGKPLICYSIDVARKIVANDDICVSTDSDEIKEVVEQYGLHVPFKRPVELATDTATTNDVLLHALNFYEQKGIIYNIIILLQPTSPLRTSTDIQEALRLYNNNIDMVVSVKESHVSSVMCNENEKGYLELVFNKNAQRRQDTNVFYEYNGSIYIINTQSLKTKGLVNMTKKVKYVMPEEKSIDIDNQLDWNISECLLSKKNKLL